MRKTRKSQLHIEHLYFFIMFTLLLVQPVHAYIDPSVMTYAIQAVAGIAIALGAAFSIVWRKVRKKLFKDGERHYAVMESDDVTFNDPAGTPKRALEGIDITVTKQQVKDDKPLTFRDRIMNFLRSMIPGVLLSAAACFMIAIYAPLEIYMNNKTEFWFDFPLIFPHLSYLFIVGFALCVLVLVIAYLLYDNLYNALLVCFLTGFVCTYIQGNYLISHLPSFDGAVADWSEYLPEMKQSAMLWVIVFVIVILILRFIKIKNFRLFTSFVSVLISAMLAVSLISINIKNKGTAPKDETFVISRDYMYEMSSQKNFIIFLVDATDATSVTEVMDLYPEYKEKLSGFTYYPDTLAGYSFTTRSIPLILTGEWYENQMDFSDFYTQAMDKSPLIKKLEEQNYDLDLYDTGLIYNSENVYKFQNIYKTTNKFTSRKDYLIAQLKFVGFKYAPYFLKKYFTVSANVYLPLQMMVTENGEKFTRRTASDCKSRIYNWTDGCAYNQILKDEVTYTEDPVFHYIHLEGSHLPFTFNKDMVYDSTKSYTYYDKVAASLTIITSYCEKLKEAGIYDNTAIVVLADHGYNRIHDDAKAFGRQNPLLMIKGFNEDHEMNTSSVQISYDDLQQIYSRLLDGALSDEVVDYQEGEVRTRRFLHLRYLGEDHLTEFETKSNAADTDAMYETGRVYDYGK